MRRHGFVDVLENADDAQHRRGIDAFAQSLVVEADVAAGDRNIEFFAGLGDAVDHLRELPHDLRLFRIAEVQAVGRANRSRARARHIAAASATACIAPSSRIEIAPAAIAIERHRQPALSIP